MKNDTSGDPKVSKLRIALILLFGLSFMVFGVHCIIYAPIWVNSGIFACFSLYHFNRLLKP